MARSPAHRARRLAFRLALLLVIGALANVGIAWGLAMRSGYGFEGELPEPLADETRWRGTPGPDWPACAEGGYEVNMTGFRFVLQSQNGPDPGNEFENPTLYQLYSWQVGWPMRSMTWELRGTIPNARGTIFGSVNDEIPLWRRGLEAPSGWHVWESPASGCLRRLPLRPVLEGFVVDTLLYASIAGALAFLPRKLRRMVRGAGGRCEGCGYDARGLKNCPECNRPSPTAGS